MLVEIANKLQMQVLLQDMYAWSVACAQAAEGPIASELHPEFMLQPPFDTNLDIRVSLVSMEGRD